MKKLLAITTLFSLPLFAAPEDEDPCCEDWSLFVHRRQTFVNTEFLFWTVQEGALDYAIRMESPAWGPTPAFAKGDYKIARYEWEPGFRVSAGWYNEPHYWEVLGQYTWFYDRGSQVSHKPSQDDLFVNATWNNFSESDVVPLRRASSTIDLHYHVGDLLATRVFDTNPHLRIRVIGGLTLAHISQSWKIRYSNFIGNHDILKDRWTYFAGGIRLGFSLDWFWGCQFYLTGKSSVATYLGSYKNQTIQRTNAEPTVDDDPSISVRNAEYKDHRFALHAQIMLGPSWQRPGDCVSMELFAGYELNLWLNLQEAFRSSQSGPSGIKETNLASGLLGLHGLTARLTIGF